MLYMEIGVVCVVIIALACAVKAAPLPTLLTIAAVGVITQGQIPLPGTLSGRVEAARADVRQWQNQQADRAVCNIRARQAIISADFKQIEAAAAYCDTVNARHR